MLHLQVQAIPDSALTRLRPTYITTDHHLVAVPLVWDMSTDSSVIGSFSGA